MARTVRDHESIGAIVRYRGRLWKVESVIAHGLAPDETYSFVLADYYGFGDHAVADSLRVEFFA